MVRAHVEARPETGRIHGPHGISLLRHARAGGDEAAPVVDYLLDRLGPDEAEFGIPADEAMAERYASPSRRTVG